MLNIYQNNTGGHFIDLGFGILDSEKKIRINLEYIIILKWTKLMKNMTFRKVNKKYAD